VTRAATSTHFFGYRFYGYGIVKEHLNREVSEDTQDAD